MASPKEMHTLIGYTVSDPSFREKMAADPVQTASQMGITLTPEQTAAFKSEDVIGSAESLGQRLSKMGICGLGGGHY
jgi:hypothetical protein